MNLNKLLIKMNYFNIVGSKGLVLLDDEYQFLYADENGDGDDINVHIFALNIDDDITFGVSYFGQNKNLSNVNVKNIPDHINIQLNSGLIGYGFGIGCTQLDQKCFKVLIDHQSNIRFIFDRGKFKLSKDFVDLNENKIQSKDGYLNKYDMIKVNELLNVNILIYINLILVLIYGDFDRGWLLFVDDFV